MKVKKEEFKKVLESLRPALARKEYSSQTSHFVFFPDKIVTFNEDVCISHPFESDESFSVRGEEFYKLIDGITDEEIEITVGSKRVNIRSKSTSSSMAILDDEQLNSLEGISSMEKTQKKWKPLSEDFLEGISLCSFSASPDLTKGVQACVVVKKDTCYSFDQIRASLYELKDPIEDDLFIVARHVVELIKFPVIEYCTNKSWMHFRTSDQVTFSCKMISGDFLPFEGILPLFEKMVNVPSISLPPELKSIIDNVTILADDTTTTKGKLVLVTFCHNKIYAKAENELGWIEKVLSYDYPGELELRINAKFFSQVLEKTTSLAVDGHVLCFSSGSFVHLLSQVG
jgi:DNA polymerase III sliding clamp (beta) subunit (PCNA family)